MILRNPQQTKETRGKGAVNMPKNAGSKSIVSYTIENTKCDQCGYVAKSLHGLTIHRGRFHNNGRNRTTIHSNNRPFSQPLSKRECSKRNYYKRKREGLCPACGLERKDKSFICCEKCRVVK